LNSNNDQGDDDEIGRVFFTGQWLLNLNLRVIFTACLVYIRRGGAATMLVSGAVELIDRLS